MDYKRIIKSRRLRIKIMQILSFLPDQFIVELQYAMKTGRKLDLRNPQRFTEKLQWYKLFYRNSLMEQCVDKYSVREYVKSKGLVNILVPLIGIYESVDEINFADLPNQFVIKDTLGGGGNSVIVVKDKDKLDIKATRLELQNWMKKKHGKHPGREWVYDKKESRIIIEKYIESDVSNGGLIDYKFFCFNGRVKYVYGIADRELGNGAGLGVFNREFELLPYKRCDEENLKRNLEKPSNYEEMVSIAEKLSEDFPHARIDLYDQNNKILFGEITFFDGSGYMQFNPDEFDYIMGKEFILPQKVNR